MSFRHFYLLHRVCILKACVPPGASAPQSVCEAQRPTCYIVKRTHAKLIRRFPTRHGTIDALVLLRSWGGFPGQRRFGPFRLNEYSGRSGTHSLILALYEGKRHYIPWLTCYLTVDLSFLNGESVKGALKGGQSLKDHLDLMQRSIWQVTWHWGALNFFASRCDSSMAHGLDGLSTDSSCKGKMSHIYMI